MLSKGAVNVAVMTESVLSIPEPVIGGTAFRSGTAPSDRSVGGTCVGIDRNTSEGLIRGGDGCRVDRHEESVLCTNPRGLMKLKIAGSAKGRDGDFEGNGATGSDTGGACIGLYD